MVIFHSFLFTRGYPNWGWCQNGDGLICWKRDAPGKFTPPAQTKRQTNRLWSKDAFSTDSGDAMVAQLATQSWHNGATTDWDLGASDRMAEPVGRAGTGSCTCYGGFMVDLSWIYGGFTVDLRRIYHYQGSIRWPSLRTWLTSQTMLYCRVYEAKAQMHYATMLHFGGGKKQRRSIRLSPHFPVIMLQ